MPQDQARGGARIDGMFRWRLMTLGEHRRALVAALLALTCAVPVVDRLLPPTIILAPVLGLAPRWPPCARARGGPC